MKSRRFTLAIVFAVVMSFVFAYGLTPLMKPSAAAPAPADTPPFKGKVVVVNVEDKHSIPLEHAQVRKLGERSFVVGKGLVEGSPANLMNGQMVWIPMNRVHMILEFESEEKWKKAWEEYLKNAPAPPPAQAGQAGSP